MEDGVKNVVSALRQKAEMLLNNKSQDLNSVSVEADILKLVHELEVYTKEFEVQHSELEFSKIVSRDASERYNDLFNFSSTGYLILTDEGEIIDLNYTCALLLGKDRIKLKNSRFDFFLNENDKRVFDNFIENIFASTSQKNCELSLSLDDSSVVYLSLSGVLSQNKKQCLVTVHDITDYKKSEMYKDMTREILEILNEPGSFNDAIHRTLLVLKNRIGIDAVGIRLQKGDDFPYLDQIGFSNNFLLAENTLVELDKSGQKFRSLKGHVSLACSCGLVISGNAGKDKRFSTKGGSWWTNDSFPLCDIPEENDLRFHPRNYCIKQGYASIALVPIRNKSKIVGLIQFNDKRKKRFDRNSIEVFEVIALHIGSAIMRKHAEETIRKNEELLRSITANAPDTIMELDHEGTILYLSRAFAGAEMGDIVGTNIRKWVSIEYHKEIANALSRVFTEGKPHTFESSAAGSNGETRWYRSGLSPVKTEGVVKFAVMILSDITDRLNSETIIKQSIARHRAIIETTLDGFWLTDMEGRLVEANEVYSKMSGYTVPELLTMKISDIEVTETQREIFNRMQKIIEQGEDRFETQHCRKDGTVFDVELNIQYHQEKGGQFVAFLHDITKRNKHIETIRQSEERHKLLAETMLQGVVHQNSAGDIIFMNPSAERILGKSQERFIGSSSVKEERDTIREDGSPFPGEEHPAMLALRTGEQYSGVIMGVFNPQLKEYRWISIDSIPLFRSGEKKPYEVYTIFEDITERKGAEDKLNYHAGLLQNITDAIISTDENFSIKSWNKAAENIYGWKQEEVVGKSVTEILQTQYKENSTHEDSLELLFKKNAWLDEVIQKRKDNTPVNILTSVKVMRDKNGTIAGFVSVNKDVTSIKKTEVRLQQSNERYKSLFQGNHSVMLLLNPVTGEIVDANPAACNYYGWSKFEMCCKNITDINTLTKDEVTAEMENARLEKRNHFYFKHWLANDEIRDVEVYSGPIRFGETTFLYSMIHDITDRKKAEEALRQNDERYKSLFNDNHSVMMLIDPDTGEIKAANPAACEYYGWSHAVLCSKNITDINPMPREEAIKNLQQTKTQKYNHLILKHKLSTGELRDVEVYSSPIQFTDSTLIYAIIHDITEAQKVSEELKKNKDNLRAILDATKESIMVFDRDVTTIEANETAARRLGVEVGDLVGKSFSDFVSPELFATRYKHLMEVFSSGKQFKFEDQRLNYTFENHSFPVFNNGEVCNVVSFSRDVTQQKAAEENLRKSEEKFSVIYEKSSYIIALCRLEDGRIEDVNEAFEKIFEFRKEEVIGKRTDELGMNLNSEFRDSILDEIKNKGFLHDIESAFFTKSGKMRMLRYNIDSVESENQKYLLITAEDITARKQMEEALRESEYFFRVTQQAAFLGSYKTDFSTGKWESSEVLDEIFGIGKDYTRTVEGWLDIAHPVDREMMHRYLLEEVLAKKRPFDKEYRIVRQNDGETRWIHGLGKVDVDADNKVISLVGTIQDITERKLKEETLRKLNQSLAALSKSSVAIVQATDEETYLKKVCKIIVEETDFAMVWIGYAENDKEKSVRKVASAGFTDNYLGTIKLSWDDTEFGKGPTGVAIRTGEMSLCNNMFTDPNYEPWREQALKRGYRASIVFPLKFGDKVFGAISIYSNEADSFLADEVKLLSKLANDLVLGVTTIRLQKAKQLAELALKKSNDALEMQVKERTAELVKKNEAIKINEEKYRTVADFAANWEFWIGLDNVMLYCSPSCERITGYKAAEFIENNNLIYEIIHPDDIQGFKEHRETESTAHVCDREIQFRIIRKNGMVRWIGHYCKPIFDEAGNFRGIRGSNKDITARKKMEALLTTSNQKYKLLSQNISDGIFICNAGKIEYVNQAVYNIFGYKGNELAGMHLTSLVSVDKNEQMENFLYTKASENRSCNLETECIRKDQVIVYVEIMLNYIADEQLVYGVIRDVTERKLMQKKIVKTIIETQEAEKAYFSKELHDGLGPLLSTIRLYLQLTDRFATDKLKEIINKSEEILVEAISTVKEISNKLSPHLLTNYGLSSAIKSFVDKLNKNTEIEVLFESDFNERIEPEIEATLYRAIIECVNNSLKHSGAHCIEIVLKRSGNRLLIFYKDNGIGFDLEETLAKHTGLGLFNLYNRIENIGGKLLLESKPGLGVNYQFIVNI
ncbi:MAG: PAS domain S-box protein [Paludibacter sp.]